MVHLIVEECVDARVVIEEGTNGSKTYFLEGVIAQSERKNRNGRFYPRNVLFSRMKDYIREYVDKKRAFGELGHPSGPTVNPDRVSHMFTELKENGNDIYGKAKVMTALPMGKIVKGFVDEGGQLGMSTRGMGTLRDDYRGKVVQDDYRLATAGDVVLDPSAHDAFVQGIVEGVEWIMEAGEWIPQYRDKFMQRLSGTRGEASEELIVEAVGKFLRRL